MFRFHDSTHLNWITPAKQVVLYSPRVSSKKHSVYFKIVFYKHSLIFFLFAFNNKNIKSYSNFYIYGFRFSLTSYSKFSHSFSQLSSSMTIDIFVATSLFKILSINLNTLRYIFRGGWKSSKQNEKTWKVMTFVYL